MQREFFERQEYTYTKRQQPGCATFSAHRPPAATDNRARAREPAPSRCAELRRTRLGRFPCATRREEELQVRKAQQRREVGQDARPGANPQRLRPLAKS